MTFGIPKIPKLTAEQVRKAMQDGFDRHEQDQEARRCLTGKYAPPTGRCVGCGDEVRGIVAWPPWDGLIGGTSKPRAHISHWQCEGCGLMYGKCPPASAVEDKTP